MYKSFEKVNYPNLLDSIEMTYQQAIDKLKKNYYIQPPRYDKINHTQEEEDIEDRVSVPYFVDSFLKYIMEHKTIPSMYEYEMQYREDNKPFYDTYNTKNYRYAIRNRVQRAYPSLVRDVMFALFLKEKFKEENVDVIYNDELDRYEGIDIMICGKRNWGVHLFTDTRRANEYRARKNNRHGDDFYNVIDIDLVKDLHSKNKYGNIVLYGEEDYKNLLKKCEKIDK